MQQSHDNKTARRNKCLTKGKSNFFTQRWNWKKNQKEVALMCALDDCNLGAVKELVLSSRPPRLTMRNSKNRNMFYSVCDVDSFEFIRQHLLKQGIELNLNSVTMDDQTFYDVLFFKILGSKIKIDQKNDEHEQVRLAHMLRLLNHVIKQGYVSRRKLYIMYWVGLGYQGDIANSYNFIALLKVFYNNGIRASDVRDATNSELNPYEPSLYMRENVPLSGTTMLHMIMRRFFMMNEKHKVAQFLLDEGADINAIDSLGRNALHVYLTPTTDIWANKSFNVESAHDMLNTLLYTKGEAHKCIVGNTYKCADALVKVRNVRFIKNFGATARDILQTSLKDGQVASEFVQIIDRLRDEESRISAAGQKGHKKSMQKFQQIQHDYLEKKYSPDGTGIPALQQEFNQQFKSQGGKSKILRKKKRNRKLK